MHGICHASMSVSWFREQTMFICLCTYMGVSELARMCLGRKVGRIERERFVRAWSMEFGQTGPKYLQAGQLSDAEITCIPAARQVCTVQMGSKQSPATGTKLSNDLASAGS